ncbi:hypothetical protein QBC35DRAFT_500949 [Podospora australis]|uniref:WW domain-containing protein n=1 Tax=Podospora australis TaxID=1536484 RepID=A0AAN6WR43_9PEZI|nr:hypothetical protein QBC35DRAFT_500949 [Podospora australis]
MSTPAENQTSALAPAQPAEEPPTKQLPQKEAEAGETNGNDAQNTDEMSPQINESSHTKDEADQANGSRASSPSPSHASSSEDEEGEISESDSETSRNGAPQQPPLPNEPLPDGHPPLPNEPLPGTDAAAPPLPSEPLPAVTAQAPAETEDDGWDYHWNPNDSSYWFYNRFTGVWQQENPRAAVTTSSPIPAIPVVAPPEADKSTISNPTSVAGGYNPAIHGSYDENAWYAVNARAATTTPNTTIDPAAAAALLAGGAVGNGAEGFATGGFFNKQTGQWQDADHGVDRHTDEAKSKRQMNAFFDVDAAANMHDGRSLKAERSGKKPSKKELKEFKEKRRARKEEKRRAWLRD